MCKGLNDKTMPVMDIEAFSSKLIETLWALESSFRRVNPLLLARIREELLGYEGLLRSGLEVLPVQGSGSQESAKRNSLVRAAGLVLEAISIFGSGEDLTQSFLNVLKAYRKLSRAQEALFDLRHDLMQVDCYFLEPAFHAASGGHGHHDRPHSSSGISHVGTENDAYARGGYSLYVPESYDPGRSWPLVVALHGGYGHGRDYLWTWLREARSRGFVLISPTSLGQTWSLSAIEIDALQLAHHVEDVCSRFAVDRSRLLITGMSDGATFALCLALQERSFFTAAAPVSGVLPLMDLSHARGRRIFWVHGALDWMFPVSRAVYACQALKEAGADVVLRVIRDLSHAYPREENGGILAWFDPALRIPV